MPTPPVNARYTLSPADIEALLKDPNSMLSKVYQQCRYAVALEQFTQYMVALCQVAEIGRQLAIQRLDEDETNKAAPMSDVTTLPATSTTTDSLPIAQQQMLISLRNEMADLLAKDQSTMTAEQLVEHHQALTTNFMNQVAVQLGPTITLDSGLTLRVPQPTTPTGTHAPTSPLLAPLAPAFARRPSMPAVSTLLEHDPVLQNNVLANDHAKTAFAVTHANLTLGPRTVSAMYDAILQANHMTSLDDTHSKALMRAITKATEAVRGMNQGLEQALVDNIQFSLNKFSPTPQPTIRAPRP